MSASPFIHARRASQRGVSLIEVMIAMAIGLVIIGAVGYLYLGTRQTFRTTENLSRMQEGARYALEIISRDVRMAGYIGCGNMQNIPVNTIANAPVPQLSASTAVMGEDTPAAPVSNFKVSSITRPAGDSISVMGAFGGGVPLDGNLAPSNANVQMAGNPYGFVPDDVLTVTNCTNADVFRATNVSNSGSITTIAHSNSANTGNRIGTYGPDSFIFKVQQFTYFIGTNPNGKRALYRTSLTEGTAELVEDVWDMQLSYGVDTNSDNAADTYSTATEVTAAANWPRVMSARISLLLVSPEDGIVSNAQTYNFNGASVTATDRRMYQVFTSTIGIRNRLP